MGDRIASSFWSCVIAASLLGCGVDERLSPVDITGSSASSSGGGAGAGSTSSAGAGGEGGAAVPTGVVIGATSELDRANLDALRAVLRVNGDVADERLYGRGGAEPIVFPLELAFVDLSGGDEVEMELTAHSRDASAPPLQRLAKTSAVADETLLMRVHLTETCAPWDPSGADTTCEAPLTCAWGRCRGAYAPPSNLEVYSPSWPSYSYCKPPTAGAPVLELGAGQLDYSPIDDFDVLTMDSGEQGGHHIWLALRTKNLRQTSIITLAAYLPDFDLEVFPLTFPIVFIDDPTVGYCERAGILYQLDEGVPVDWVLGMAVQLTATIADEDGATTEDTRAITISETINPY